PRYEALIRARNVAVSPSDSDLTTRYEFDHPLAAIWNWITDLNCRNAAMGEMGQWKIISRNQGRTAPGASNHCAHGKGASIETILDWRPFEYTTIESADGPVVFHETIRFAALDEKRTRVEVYLQMRKPKPLFLARLMLKREFGKENPYVKWFDRINELAGKGSAE
ncbi:MAG: hypothetical protein AB1750_16150, partial [Chloroflexota bacterium]